MCCWPYRVVYLEEPPKPPKKKPEEKKDREFVLVSSDFNVQLVVSGALFFRNIPPLPHFACAACFNSLSTSPNHKYLRPGLFPLIPHPSILSALSTNKTTGVKTTSIPISVDQYEARSWQLEPSRNRVGAKNILGLLVSTAAISLPQIRLGSHPMVMMVGLLILILGERRRPGIRAKTIMGGKLLHTTSLGRKIGLSTTMQVIGRLLHIINLAIKAGTRLMTTMAGTHFVTTIAGKHFMTTIAGDLDTTKKGTWESPHHDESWTSATKFQTLRDDWGSTHADDGWGSSAQPKPKKSDWDAPHVSTRAKHNHGMSKDAWESPGTSKKTRAKPAARETFTSGDPMVYTSTLRAPEASHGNATKKGSKGKGDSIWANGADEELEFVPEVPTGNTQYYCQETSGVWKLRTTNDIMNHCQPGDWRVHPDSGYPYFVRKTA